MDARHHGIVLGVARGQLARQRVGPDAGARLDEIDPLPVRRPGRHGVGACIRNHSGRLAALDPEVAGLDVHDRSRHVCMWIDVDHVGRRGCSASDRPLASVRRRRGCRQVAIEERQGHDRDDDQSDQRQQRGDHAAPWPKAVGIEAAGRARAGCSWAGGGAAHSAEVRAAWSAGSGPRAASAARIGAIPRIPAASGCMPDAATSRTSSWIDS